MSIKNSKPHGVQTIPGTLGELKGLKKPKVKTKKQLKRMHNGNN